MAEKARAGNLRPIIDPFCDPSGSLFPPFRVRETFSVAPTVHEPKLDQHRRDIRRFQHAEVACTERSGPQQLELALQRSRESTRQVSRSLRSFHVAPARRAASPKRHFRRIDPHPLEDRRGFPVRASFTAAASEPVRDSLYSDIPDARPPSTRRSAWMDRNRIGPCPVGPGDTLCERNELVFVPDQVWRHPGATPDLIGEHLGELHDHFLLGHLAKGRTRIDTTMAGIDGDEDLPRVRFRNRGVVVPPNAHVPAVRRGHRTLPATRATDPAPVSPVRHPEEAR